jgi:hypothetical protein
MNMRLHQLDVHERLTTLPLLDDASIIMPPPMQMATWPLNTMMSPFFRLLMLVILVYLLDFAHPCEVI